VTAAHEIPVRSALFVPANRPAWIDGAYRHGADALVLDLEDATPPAEKASARATLAERLPRLAAERSEVWVRVNPLDSDEVEADLAAVCAPGVSVVCLPKASTVEEIVAADRMIGYAEGRNGLAFGTIGILPLLETAGALLDAAALFRASPRVRYGGAVATPGADIEFALGYRLTGSFEETLAYRSMVLLAARAAGIVNPITGLVSSLDLELTRRFAAQGRAIGYEGMFVIHPSQVPVANELFSPTEQEIAWSEEVLGAYLAAVDAGRGATLDSQGRMIDLAMLRTAERVRDRARHFAEPANV
jgi:citrate lyase subunit beta / citryl-CoA lyase